MIQNSAWRGIVPERFFLTCGTGRDKDKVISFGLALSDAGIGKFNLLPVSSIIPPGCRMVSKEEGLGLLKIGQIIYCVLANNLIQGEGLITAALGVAIPAAQDEVGCVFELTGLGRTKEEVGMEAEKLACDLLSKSFGLEVGRSLNIVSETRGEASIFTTVIAASVFV